MDFEQGAAVVVLSAEQHDNFGLLKLSLKGYLLLRQGFEGLGIFGLAGEDEPFLKVIPAGLKLCQTTDFFFKAPFFLKNGGERLGIVPGTWFGKFLLYLGKTFLIGRKVKDSSRGF